MKAKLLLLSLALVVCACHTGSRYLPSQGNTDVQLSHKLISFKQTVPKPSDMYSKVTVSGRVSTLNDIEIYRVGQTIPYTYSEGKIFNTPGYQWYVSKHFAMKTNFSEQDVRFYLELLESSWPHYVELFGAEPPNVENQRIAVVYSPSRKAVAVPMRDDGFTRGPNGGGETMFYNRAGYSFKSARKQHQRYIVIHETAHAFQMALMQGSSWLPNWFTEGTADAIAHHIYDPHSKRLKVMNFDRGAGHDYVRIGLEQYKQLKQPTIEQMTSIKKLYRGINFLIVHFMLDDPERSHYFKIYRDTMAELRLSGKEGAKKSVEVLSSVFPDWEKVEKDFAAYVANVDKTFNTVVGAWEQDGNAYWVRFDNKHPLLPRLDILLAPAEKPFYSRFKVDQLPLPVSQLLDSVERGVNEPAVGFVIDYQKAHLQRGTMGLGLGVALSPDNAKAVSEITDRTIDGLTIYDSDSDEFLAVLVQQADTLVIDATRMGGQLHKFPVPEQMLRSLQRQQNPSLGVTVHIQQDALVVSLRTGDHGQLRFRQHQRITPALRDKLLHRHLAVFAHNANHRITPHVDDGRRLNPQPASLVQSSAANIFRNQADREITRLTKAIWILGDQAPASLVTLQRTLIEGSWPAQQAAAHAYLNQHRATVVNDLAAMNTAGLSKAREALQALAGVFLRIEWQQQTADSHPFNAVLHNPGDLPVTAHLSIKGLTAAGELLELNKEVAIAARAKQSLRFNGAKRDEARPVSYIASADVQWLGQTVQLMDSFTHPYPWSTFELTGPAVVEDNEVVVSAIVRGPLAGESKGVMRFQLLPGSASDQQQEAIDIAPYEVKTVQKRFALKPGVDPVDIAVDVELDISLDGEPLLLRQRARVK